MTGQAAQDYFPLDMSGIFRAQHIQMREGELLTILHQSQGGKQIVFQHITDTAVLLLWGRIIIV